MIVKKIINIVLAMMTIGAMSVSSLAVEKDTHTEKFTMKNGFKELHNAFNFKIKPYYGTYCVKIIGNNGYESKPFNISSDKTITVKNAKPDVWIIK